MCGRGPGRPGGALPGGAGPIPPVVSFPRRARTRETMTSRRKSLSPLDLWSARFRTPPHTPRARETSHLYRRDQRTGGGPPPLQAPQETSPRKLPPERAPSYRGEHEPDARRPHCRVLPASVPKKGGPWHAAPRGASPERGRAWVCQRGAACGSISPGGAGGARGGRTVRGEFATQRAGWRTRCAVVTPCSSSACVACAGRVRHFATPTAVRNCPPPAPRPEILPQPATVVPRAAE